MTKVEKWFLAMMWACVAGLIFMFGYFVGFASYAYLYDWNR